jgi:hypothetical protein
MHPREYEKRKAASGGQVELRLGPDQCGPDDPRTAPVQARAPPRKVATSDPRAFGLTKPVYGVNEVLGLLHIGRTAFYAAVRRGEIRLTKRGKTSLIFADDIAAYLTNLRNGA